MIESCVHAPEMRVGKGLQMGRKMILENIFWYHMVSSESNAEADVHDAVINGNSMAGHVKTCRDWDQLFMEGAFSQGTWYTVIIVQPHSKTFHLRFFMSRNVKLLVSIN